MKKTYIEDIDNSFKDGEYINLSCWIKNKRSHAKTIFFDLVDSTGTVEAMINQQKESVQFDVAKKTKVESCIEINGTIKKSKELRIEIISINIVGDVKLSLTPNPRSDFDFYNPKYTNHILNNRHFYIRNPHVIATIKLKNSLLKSFRDFFENKKFTEVDMPILSQGYLYSSESSFKTDYFGTEAYLSQCCGLYLGATVNALERIFTVAPSFRTEPSKSPRHNPEFWHIKAQVAFFDLDDMITFTSEMIYEVVELFKVFGVKELEILDININSDALKPPYPVITYDDAVQIIKKSNKDFVWGKSFSQSEEKLISSKFTAPVFIKGMPSQVEPFPYKVDENNPKITKTADLLCTGGFGELLGVAEFITDEKELEKRIAEKKNESINNIQWYKELPLYGEAPFSGFGMGVERALRWLLKLAHVRDAFLFPRLYNRKLYP